MPRSLRPAEGLLTLLGLGLMLWTVLDSVMQAAWVEHLGILGWIAVGAVFTSFVLAKTRLPASLCHGLSLAVGAPLVLFFVSRTIASGFDTRDRMGQLWQRFTAWLEITVSGGSGTDNLLFLLFLAALGWAIVYFAIWSVYRDHGVWIPILSTGAGLIVNLSYARDLSWYIIPYLVGAFALVVRLNVYRQEQAWQRAGVDYETEFGWDFLSTGLVVSGVIIAMVWFAPRAYAAEQISDRFSAVSQPWRDVEGEFNRLFGGLAARYEGGGGRVVGISGISRVMALRGSTNLAPSEIMYIESPRRSYWRGVVYERYTGTGWMMGELTSHELSKGDPRLGSGAEPKGRLPITYTVVVLEPRGEAVVAAAEPRRFSIPVRAELSRVPSTFQSWTGEGELPAGMEDPVEVGMVRSEAVGRRGSYSAVSLISVADESSLRQASTNYPEWVKERYLQLPRLPREVANLARQVAGENGNAYERAKAIETYLRTNYSYSENVIPATGGEDAVAHFLFTGKAGYCDYFASAMAVMLRTQGIPARVAAGYASGVPDEDNAVWTIRDSDSHAWVEAYFPGYGWIDFEPTPIRPVPVRMDSAEGMSSGDSSYWDDDPWMDDFPLDPSTLDFTYTPPETGGINIPRVISYGGAGLLGLVGVLAVVLGLAWQRGLGGFTVGEAAYARMCRLAGWLGVRQAAYQTPAEYAWTLGEKVPEVRREAHDISETYVRLRFGRKVPGGSEESALQQAWERLRNGMLVAFLRGPGLGRRRD